MKQKLPKLKLKLKDFFITNSYFANLIKQLRAKTEKLINEEISIENEENKFEKGLEEKKANIENQRF